MRYYDLLSFSEQLCLDKKQQRKLKRNIVAAKQKLIFYLSYLKSDLWKPEKLDAAQFVTLFANDKMYQKISKSQREKLRQCLMKTKLLVKEETADEEPSSSREKDGGQTPLARHSPP